MAGTHGWARAQMAGMIAAAMIAGLDQGRAGPDLELGRYLAAECMTCHRAQTSASSIPNLSTLSASHLIEVVKAYRAGLLPNEAMQNVASRLSDQDIESLALYFSTVKQP